MRDTTHQWEKTNLVTLEQRGRFYDMYKCTLCGMTARSDRLGAVNIPYGTEACEKAPVAKRVRVTVCHAQGKCFSNLTTNSEHDVIAPPEEYAYAKGVGVWVMGVGEPVKLLPHEYVEVEV